MKITTMLLWALLSTVSGANPAPLSLSLEEALARGAAYHPLSKVSQSRVNQAAIAQASARTLPPLTVGVGSWQGSGDVLTNGNYIAQNRPDYYFYAQQQFLPPGQQRAREQLAGQELESARAADRLQQIQLIQQIKDSYYAKLGADEELRLALENLHLAQEICTVADRRFQDGSGPQINQTVASVQKSKANLERRASESQIAEKESRLAYLLGLPPGTPVRCTSELTLKPLAPLEEAVGRLAQTHPRLLMARAALEASHHQRELAERQGGPTPGIQAIYDAVRPSYAVHLTLSIPLDWGTLGSEVEQRREIEKEKEHGLAAESLQVQSDASARQAAYLRSYEQATQYRERILLPTEQIVKVTQYGYDRGAIPYLQLLNAQQQLSQLRRDYVQRLLQAHLDLNALEFAVGQPPP